MASKRTLDSFFQASSSKKPKLENNHHYASLAPTSPDFEIHTLTNSYSPENLLTPSLETPSMHPSYPIPIPQIPSALAEALSTSIPGHAGKLINDAPDLDLLYFQPFIPQDAARALFTFLRASLPFYRVKYNIRRGAHDTEINTPRFTTVFGLDESARFSTTAPSSPAIIVDAKTSRPVPEAAYACAPRPIPGCLELLRRLAEAFTGAEYNFVLVNYYASGADSISYHSDDEKFLGPDPTIASLSLGATRDFLMRHKPLARDARKDATAGIYGNRGTVGDKGGGVDDAAGELLTAEEEAVREAHRKPLKLPMAGGDMVLMRGKSQSHWLHSIPKRSGKGSEGGRINITFRKAMVRGGTENYYQYNVGRGPLMKWDAHRNEMVEIDPSKVSDGANVTHAKTGDEKQADDKYVDKKSYQVWSPVREKVA